MREVLVEGAHAHAGHLRDPRRGRGVETFSLQNPNGTVENRSHRGLRARLPRLFSRSSLRKDGHRQNLKGMRIVGSRRRTHNARTRSSSVVQFAVNARPTMKLRFRADWRTLVWSFALMPGLVVVHFAWPSLAGWLLPLSMYAAYSAAVIAHNHNHCPTFVSKSANRRFSNWISFFYG